MDNSTHISVIPNLDALSLPEIYLIVCTILIILFSACIICIKLKVTRKLSKYTNYATSTEYSKTKSIVSQYLDENPQFSEIGKMVTLDKLSNNHAKKGEEAAEDYFKHMLQHHSLKPNQKEDLNKSIRFELKRRLIRHPYDIRGARRCYLLETILDQVWKGSTEDGSCLHKIKSILSSFSFGSGDSMKEMRICGIYVFVILKVVIFGFGVWCYDIFTDGQVLYVFLSFMCLLDDDGRYCPMDVRSYVVNRHCFGLVDDSPGYTNITDSCYDKIPGGRVLQHLSVKEKNEIVAIVAVHNFILLVFYLGSLLHAITSKPVHKYLQQIQCSLLMALPHHEENDTEVPTAVVTERYRINIDESGFEAIVNMSLQWANYYNLVYHLTLFVDNHASEDQIKLLLGYNTVLISGCVSILSLVFSQMKAHNTQHRFNTSLLQKLVYFFACLANTLSFGCLFVAYLTYCVQYCASEYFVHEVGSARYFGGYGFCGIICLTCLGCFKKMTSVMHTYLLYGNDFFKKLKKEETPKRKKDIFGEWFNTGENLQLPPSNTWSQPYNSSHAFSLLRNLSRQCFSNVFILCWIIFQSSYNYFQFDFDPSIEPEFQGFIYASMLLIPGGWIVSYLFLWAFFKLDHGFFSGTHIRFVYTDIQPHCTHDDHGNKDDIAMTDINERDSVHDRDDESKISIVDDLSKIDEMDPKVEDRSCCSCCGKNRTTLEHEGYWQDLNEELCLYCP